MENQVRRAAPKARRPSLTGLRVGDRIRIVRLPSLWDEPGYVVPDRVRKSYERLIARGRALRVHEIDPWGFAWVQFRFLERGKWAHHFLALDADSWVRVQSRRRTRRCT